MSEEKKIECVCGSVVFQKNMNAHTKTAKHKACVSGVVPPKLERTKSERAPRKGVNFAEAQQSNVADQDDELSEGSEAEDELDDGFEDEVMEALENIIKHLEEQTHESEDILKRVEETRLKVNSCLGECREVAMNQPYAKQINEMNEVLQNLVKSVNDLGQVVLRTETAVQSILVRQR
jgi:hypothetical protein